MISPTKISDAMFNGFVDGRLSARAEREVTVALTKDPAGAARATAWRRQSDALRAAFGPIADEPLPLPLILKVRAALPDRRWTHPAMIAAATFLAGLATGFIVTWVTLQW